MVDSRWRVDRWCVFAEAGFIIPPWSAGLQIRRQRGEGGLRPAHVPGLTSVPLRCSDGGNQVVDSRWRVDRWCVLAEAGFVIPPWSAGLQIRRQRGEGGLRPAHAAGLTSVPLRCSDGGKQVVDSRWRVDRWCVFAEAGFVIPPWSAGFESGGSEPKEG